MDKKKVVYHIVFLALAIFAFVGCMLGDGFGVFDYWQHLGDIFKSSFFGGMLYLVMPIALILSILLILIEIYALLKELQVIKKNAFDKPYAIIRKVVIFVMIVCLVYVLTGIFNLLG